MIKKIVIFISTIIVLCIVFSIYKNNNIFVFKHIDINNFKNNNTGKFTFRNTTWGMTDKEVFKADHIPFHDKYLDFSLANNPHNQGLCSIISKEKIKIRNKPAKVIYQFWKTHNKKYFYNGIYRFEFNKENLQEGINFCLKLEEKLRSIYGKPNYYGFENLKKINNINYLDNWYQQVWTTPTKNLRETSMTLSFYYQDKELGDEKILIDLSFNGNGVIKWPDN